MEIVKDIRDLSFVALVYRHGTGSENHLRFPRGSEIILAGCGTKQTGSRPLESQLRRTPVQSLPKKLKKETSTIWKL